MELRRNPLKIEMDEVFANLILKDMWKKNFESTKEAQDSRVRMITAKRNKSQDKIHMVDPSILESIRLIVGIIKVSIISIDIIDSKI